MTEPAVTIRLDTGGRVYQPGESLSGEYRLEGSAPEEIRAVEVSVLWYTDGKGDSDMAVHYFRRLSTDDGDPIDPCQAGGFRTTLPNSPLSYEGAILKLRWCIRVRAFFVNGKELLEELPFHLGGVPPVKADST